MDPRFNDWTQVMSVQLETEGQPDYRPVRLSSPAARVGDPVRVTIAGAEVEGVIAAVLYSVLHVRIGSGLVE